MSKKRNPSPSTGLPDEEFSPAPPLANGSQVLQEIPKPKLAKVEKIVRKIAGKKPVAKAPAPPLERPVFPAVTPARAPDLSQIPTSLESAFSFDSEQKKQAEVLSTLLGTDKDVYAILERTDLTQYEADMVPDGLWLADNGIGGEMKFEIPEVRDWIIKRVRARVSLDRGSRKEFVDAWKPSLDALRKEWEAEQRKKERLMGG